MSTQDTVEIPFGPSPAAAAIQTVAAGCSSVAPNRPGLPNGGVMYLSGTLEAATATGLIGAERHGGAAGVRQTPLPAGTS